MDFLVKAPPLRPTLYGMGMRSTQLYKLARVASDERLALLFKHREQERLAAGESYFGFAGDIVQRLKQLRLTMGNHLLEKGLAGNVRTEIDALAQVFILVRSTTLSSEHQIRDPFDLLAGLALKLRDTCRVIVREFTREYPEDQFLLQWFELGAAILNTEHPEIDEDELHVWDPFPFQQLDGYLNIATVEQIDSAIMDWCQPEEVRRLADELNLNLDALIPSRNPNSSQGDHLFARIPRLFPCWFRAELGFEDLLYGSSVSRPRDPRDDVFLVWESELDPGITNVNRVIADRWNSLDKSERSKIAPNCTEDVSTQTVKKSRQLAKERRRLQSTMNPQKIY